MEKQQNGELTAPSQPRIPGSHTINLRRKHPFAATVVNQMSIFVPVQCLAGGPNGGPSLCHDPALV